MDITTSAEALGSLRETRSFQGGTSFRRTETADPFDSGGKTGRLRSG